MSIIINNKEDALTINVVDNSAIIDHIPPMVYVVDYNVRTGTVLLVKDRKRFDTPDVVYGKKHKKHMTLIVDEFTNSPKAVGAILHGLKGAGKSLLAEAICNNSLSRDYPVFLINTAVPPHVILMLSKITSGCVFYFDEYCKVYYDTRDSQAMLTVFSDSSLTKTLFLVCDNNITSFNEYLVNRPGRFLFNIEFKGIDADVVNELCDIHSITDELRTELLVYVSIHQVSMDVVKTLLRFAKLSDNKAEFFEYISVLNVPEQKYVRIAATADAGTYVFTGDGYKEYGHVSVEGNSVVLKRRKVMISDGSKPSEPVEVESITLSLKDVIATTSSNNAPWQSVNQQGHILGNVRFSVTAENVDTIQPESYVAYDGLDDVVKSHAQRVSQGRERSGSQYAKAFTQM